MIMYAKLVPIFICQTHNLPVVSRIRSLLICVLIVLPSLHGAHAYMYIVWLARL